MRPLFKVLAGFVGVVIIAIVVVVIFFDWNWLRSPLEWRLSAASGKHVTIAGPIQGEFTMTPHITLEDIRIEEPDWKPKADVAKIARVDAVVDVKSLLRGTLSIPSLKIAKPSLNLERKADGTANWDIAKEATGPSDRGSVPLLGEVEISDGAITYRDPAKHVSIDATIATIKGNGGVGNQPFVLEGKGTYQHAPFNLKLTGDSLSLMRNEKDPYKVNIIANLGNTKIIAGGTIVDPIKMTGLALGLQVEGQNAADLYPYLGIPAPETPPYHLGGTLDRNAKDIWVFRDFGGIVGKSDLKGALTFDLTKPRLFISGTLYSENLNLVDLGLLVGAPTKTDGKESADQKRVKEEFERSDRLLPDAPLNIDAVRNVDADLTFKGAKLLAQDLPLDHIDMHIKMDNGVLTLDPVQIGVAGGTMKGTIAIDARSDVVQTDSDIRFVDFQLADFLDRSNQKDPATSGIIDGRLRFKGTGNSVRKALGTADGTASFIVGKGTMSKLTASLLGLDVARALGVLISGDKKIELRCIVTDFDVKDGIMTPRAMVLDSSQTLVVGKGTISLSEEKIDLELKGSPKGATLGLHGPINVNGTFRHPAIGLSAGTYARIGGSVVLGVVLAPVAAILTFIDSGKSHDADCAQLETVAAQNAAKEPPVDTTPPPPKRKAGAKQPAATDAAVATQPKAQPKAAPEKTQTKKMPPSEQRPAAAPSPVMPPALKP